VREPQNPTDWIGSMMDSSTHSELVHRLEEYIAARILKQPQKRIEAGASLITSGLVDSFSLVDLALHIEDTYGVHVDDTELNASTFDTLDQLAALVESRRGS
jgi:acyl carrier protein